MLSLSPGIGDPLREAIGFLSRELTLSEPGQNTVLDRLLDILLVLAIRTSLRQSTSTPRWYRASADPRLKAALEAMHGDAAHSWSVPELAKLSGMSRAAFARAFGETLGQPPMQYLTDWRMTLARDYHHRGSYRQLHTDVWRSFWDSYSELGGVRCGQACLKQSQPRYDEPLNSRLT